MSNVVRVDFGKVKDEFFDDDRPVYTLSISWQAPRWWARLRHSVSNAGSRDNG